MTDTEQRKFKPLRIAVLTVSDTRNEATDMSGKFLADHLQEAGHELADKQIVVDDIDAIRTVLSNWIADPATDAIITTGGTGLTGRDGTPEAVEALLDKRMEGFGELFRALSYEEIGTSSVQSRCLAGVADGTYIFCLPGSTHACRTGWERIIGPQLDFRTRPCNLAEMMPRLKE